MSALTGNICGAGEVAMGNVWRINICYKATGFFRNKRQRDTTWKWVKHFVLDIRFNSSFHSPSPNDSRGSMHQEKNKKKTANRVFSSSEPKGTEFSPEHPSLEWSGNVRLTGDRLSNLETEPAAVWVCWFSTKARAYTVPPLVHPEPLSLQPIYCV